MVNKEESKRKDDDIPVWAVLLIGLTLFLVFGWISYSIITDDSYEREYIIVEGVVTDVIPVTSDDGSIDYFYISFDTGEQYRIKSSQDLDLTVNSKFIIELFYYPNLPEDFKFINQIIKVPENLEEG